MRIAMALESHWSTTTQKQLGLTEATDMIYLQFIIYNENVTVDENAIQTLF